MERIYAIESSLELKLVSRLERAARTTILPQIIKRKQTEWRTEETKTNERTNDDSTIWFLVDKISRW